MDSPSKLDKVVKYIDKEIAPGLKIRMPICLTDGGDIAIQEEHETGVRTFYCSNGHIVYQGI